MTATLLDEADFMAVLKTATSSLFRLELQAAYEVEESAEVAAFAAGRPAEPTDVEPWLDQVRAWRAEGITVQRVRVQHDPPTNYQKWERWVGAWNIDAGESLLYMDRRRAHDIGLLPDAGPDDWWLIDSKQLVVLAFDDRHRKTRTELVVDPVRVAMACAWRDLAVHHATPESFSGIASQGIRT